MKYLACVMAASCAFEAYELIGWPGVAGVFIGGYIAASIIFNRVSRKTRSMTHG